MFYFVSARWHIALLADNVQSLFELLTFPLETSAVLKICVVLFLFAVHKRMQVEKQGKQDPKPFGIATLAGILMSLKCNQLCVFHVICSVWLMGQWELILWCWCLHCSWWKTFSTMHTFVFFDGDLEFLLSCKQFPFFLLFHSMSV